MKSIVEMAVKSKQREQEQDEEKEHETEPQLPQTTPNKIDSDSKHKLKITLKEDVFSEGDKDEIDENEWVVTVNEVKARDETQVIEKHPPRRKKKGGQIKNSSSAASVMTINSVATCDERNKYDEQEKWQK